MHSTVHTYEYIKRHFKCYLACGVIAFSMPSLAVANDIEDTSAVTTAEFNSDFLIGDAKKIDINRFAQGNAILPGRYNVDVYVNESWFGKHQMVFKSTEDDRSSYTCFSSKQLLEYGIKAALIKKRLEVSDESCQKIGDWVEDSFYEFDTSKLRFDISIPQIAMERNAQGYVDPSVWDRGINAAFVSYNASTYKTHDKSQNNADNTNAFVSLNTGANLAGWQFRHNGQWKWEDETENQDSKSTYDSISTYAQRAFPKYQGVLTLGDSFTNGELFNSFGYRGAEFSSDDRMLPSSMLGYAPRIRGNAKTNAKVEIRQQGQLIYQTTVAAGSFEINDLYPTGFGGELEVSILEANGDVQKYSVPYASVAQMLRPGMSRYSLMTGQLRDADIDMDPFIVQGQYQRGVNNRITAYGGFQGSEDYTAITLGSAFATPIGAVALDVTHSKADFDRREKETGQSYRISYSKLITPTNTNLTLAAYRYSTENYYNLRDALLAQELEKNGVGSGSFGKQRSELQVTLNQGLPNDWGNLYATGSWVDYWDRQEASKQYQIGYSNNYRNLNYGLSAIRRMVENSATSQNEDDTEYMLTLSLPLSFKRNAVNLNSVHTQNNTTVGMSGVVGDRFNYGASVSTDYEDSSSLSANAQYRTNFTTLGGSYGTSDQYEQVSLTARGNIVAHSDGVLFGPDQGQTMVLVYAPNATGAKVNNTNGLTINKSGYAVIPYVTPYRLNEIVLNPEGMSLDVELDGTSQRIAPYAGSISKVDFVTKSGKALYIRSLNTKGETLPFAAEVYDSKGEYVGMVAQGSLVYIRTNTLSDTVTVKWGEEKNEQCNIHYDVTTQAPQSEKNMLMLEGLCQ
ncbi:fimbria/pilus outer membrane usher protein [Psychrobacter sp. DAB_AL32B]|uniref:fimbria/pilus outer membrane usher protein n=1 Tax=Psychrobacter sp. DAB_AL32B TaxID=1028414 RepID=UPI000B7D3A19|nr:fimbria/pilus outer membrane usher protein [Psychrobacter sp. DAB_AL32B]OXL18923.1 fimbrial protein [Psychrobacter sp. DAB_AL32B]QBQ68698.1 outer membrane usher protein [Psychrobacter sp. DAB_AL32B]